MAMPWSGWHCGGYRHRSLRMTSSQAYLCTVQQECQKENAIKQDMTGPVHQFRLPPRPGVDNREKPFLLGPSTALARRRPRFF